MEGQDIPNLVDSIENEKKSRIRRERKYSRKIKKS